MGGWAEYRKNNKWARVAYAPVKAVKHVAKHVKNAGKAVVDAHKTAYRHVKAVGKKALNTVVDVHKAAYKHGKAALKKMCFWCDDEEEEKKKKEAAAKKKKAASATKAKGRRSVSSYGRSRMYGRS